MKKGRTRTKACEGCQQERNALFRAQLAAEGPWRFLCEPCLLQAKRTHPEYRYGGTWKAKKRH